MCTCVICAVCSQMIKSLSSLDLNLLVWSAWGNQGVRVGVRVGVRKIICIVHDGYDVNVFYN